VADAGHGLQELFEARRLGVERFEDARAAALRFVLWEPGAQGLGEMSPERIEAVIGHLEDAANVRRLLAVEEEIGFRRVGVTIALTRQEPQRDQRVEEIERRSGVQPEPAAERGERFGAFRQFSEHAELDGAEQRLGGPECQPCLHDPFGCQLRVHPLVSCGNGVETSKHIRTA
jgi:hypothetical protein